MFPQPSCCWMMGLCGDLLTGNCYLPGTVSIQLLVLFARKRTNSYLRTDGCGYIAFTTQVTCESLRVGAFFLHLLRIIS